MKFVVFIFIIISQLFFDINAQNLESPRTNLNPVIDGILNESEWSQAKRYNITFNRNDNNHKHDGILYLQHNNIWLYLGVDSKWNSGWDVYLQFYIDGNNDNKFLGNLNEPHTDFLFAVPSPTGWNGYNVYRIINENKQPNVSPPYGTEKASYGNRNVTYEFKIKISELNLNPSNTFGFYFYHGSDGTGEHGYTFPQSDINYSLYKKPINWAHIKLLNTPSLNTKPQTKVKQIMNDKELKRRIFRIAIFDFKGKGISNTDASALTDKLRFELFNTKAFILLERDKMDEILKEQGFQMSGCTSNECLVEAGKIIGVEKIVFGSIVKVGDVISVLGRLVDVETGKVINIVNYETKNKIGELLISGMKEVAFKFCDY